jgi:predicted nuclease of predicted toxin-antitoxin system
LSPRHPKFRFYLDENFPAPAGEFLKSRGHNVFSVISKKKLRSLSDLNQIKEANRQDRILVALDKDFKANPVLTGKIRDGQGVILIESADPRSEKIVNILRKTLKDMSETKLRGKICCASIDKIIYR